MINPYRMKIHLKTIAKTQRSIAKAFELHDRIRRHELRVIEEAQRIVRVEIKLNEKERNK